MNDEILTLVKWALPPVAAAAATVITVLWRRLLVVEDRHVELIQEYATVLRDLHDSLGTLSSSLRTRQEGSGNRSQRD